MVAITRTSCDPKVIGAPPVTVAGCCSRTRQFTLGSKESRLAYALDHARDGGAHPMFSAGPLRTCGGTLKSIAAGKPPGVTLALSVSRARPVAMTRIAGASTIDDVLTLGVKRGGGGTAKGVASWAKVVGRAIAVTLIKLCATDVGGSVAVIA